AHICCAPIRYRPLWRLLGQVPWVVEEATAAGQPALALDFYRSALHQFGLLAVLAGLVGALAYYLAGQGRLSPAPAAAVTGMGRASAKGEFTCRNSPTT